MKIQINITKEILEQSKLCGFRDYRMPENYPGQNCAIAKAIVELLGKDTVVLETEIRIFKEVEYKTTEDGLKVHFHELLHVIQLPERAIKFIKRFDELDPEDRVKLRPISFVIDVPDAYIDKIGINEALAILRESKSMQLV